MSLYVTMSKLKYEKGIWWMPWRMEAMKDVLGCEKPGGAAKKL
jgi:hypothetical protein